MTNNTKQKLKINFITLLLKSYKFYSDKILITSHTQTRGRAHAHTEHGKVSSSIGLQASILNGNFGKNRY